MTRSGYGNTLATRMARPVGLALLIGIMVGMAVVPAGAQRTEAGGESPPAPAVVTEADCTASRVGPSIAASAIGEPVRSVVLQAPVWVAAAGSVPAHCRVDGAMAPVDTRPSAKPINFRVLLPATWNGRAAQLGGGGMNGTIPNLAGGDPGSAAGGPLARGMATYGSDSGHQMAFPGGGPGGRGRGAAPGNAPPAGRGRGAPPRGGGFPPVDPATLDWTLNEEAIRNLGYLQLKKTHDVAMVVIERMYGARPRFNYYVGTSQGGREGLMVAQRYPADYDGVAANVPIVSFSSLMLAPEWIRIQERPAANWVPPAKVEVIRTEFMRQCDGLDGLDDGVINNYQACRAVFDLSQGDATRRPWTARRCPNGVDPNPGDTSATACLTDGQIATLGFIYSRYAFASPLAHGVRSFGMWVPNTDPSGSGLLLDARVRGQEGAAPDAPMHSHLGVAGVTGFLMQDLSANPLDYEEGGRLDARRRELSAWLDAANPDLSAFAARGGRLVVAIGTNDTLASPGAQLDYYQSVLDTMGQAPVDRFARFYVLPQTGHGLTGQSAPVAGNGQARPAAAIPNTFDRLTLLTDWVERGVAPGRSVTVTAGERSLPMCSYPEYPRYTGGGEAQAGSYTCTRP